MDSFETGRLLYLGLLGTAVAGYFFVSNRHRLGQVAQQAAVWGLIFLGAIAGYGLWSDIRDDVLPQQAVFAEAGRIEVPRAFDGHYYAILDVNGAPIRFVVDTGATDIVLSREDAVKAGIDPDRLAYTGLAGTANGTVRTARVRLHTLTLGPFADRRVAAWVNEGDMDFSLLGMAYLQRFDRLEISDGRMILER